MRRKKYSEEEMERLQKRVTSARKQMSDDCSYGETEQEMVDKRAFMADWEATMSILDDLLKRQSGIKEILLKKIDGIPLLPHEEAMFNSILGSILPRRFRTKS